MSKFFVLAQFGFDPRGHKTSSWDLKLGLSSGLSKGFENLDNHYRAASCPGPGQSCGWDFYYSGSPNVHDLKGALVGGPNKQDQWADDRTNYAVIMMIITINQQSISCLLF